MISVRTAQPCYMGGETITGHIEVNSREPLHCDSIKFTVTGYEKCKFDVLHARSETQNDGTIRTWYDRTKAKDKHDFFDRSEKSMWSGTIPADPQVIPFEFPLPNNLPASFHMKGREGSGERERKWEARIVYKVKVRVDLPGRPDLKCKQKLVMVEPPHAPTNPFHDEKEGSALCCLCIPRGKVRLAADFERLQVYPGERFNFHLSVHNESGMDVRSTKTKLMRVVELNADRQRWMIVSQVGPTGTFKAIPAGEALEQDVHLDIHHSVEPATTLGRHVKCTFHMDIECDIAFAPDVELHRSVDIVPNRPSEWGSQFYQSSRKASNVAFLDQGGAGSSGYGTLS